ncbi:hypothetical protein PVL29_021639 [Vitis rotundifolia]|uniref:Protein kinase domain-containing protein n=1 Tax=Vitis rotundifolia TaxID=103349 RepID=A0AA38Z009_VITRO|nr:hypothetical protein PVL29_021639 [Vitis rotundifolia]
MMWRDTKLLALGLITVLLHACFFSICVANSNKTCRPSSCGDIQSISDPFRLKGDPDGCGDRKYELVCENNHAMVKLYHRKYYVAEINYPNQTIRVVDPSLKKGNCFSTPPYSLTRENFSDEDPYQLPYEWRLKPTLLINCDGPVSGHNYIPIVPCHSPSSQTYAYALVGDSMQVSDIPYSCTMGVTIVTRLLKAHSDHSNRSMANLQEELLRGVEISFLPFRCKECDMSGTVCCRTCGSGYETPTRNGSKDWLLCIISSLRLIQIQPRIFERKISGKSTNICRFRTYLSNRGYYYYDPIIGGWILQKIAMLMFGRYILGGLCMLSYLIYKFQRRHLSWDDSIEEFLRIHKNLQPIKYSYSDIKKMTHNFRNKLGQGGFGSVYKGKLRSGRIVAVKIFINEVATIGRIHHVNVVKLVGFCVQGPKWALIYEFMHHGSLDKFIFFKQENDTPLSWEMLYKIALGVGRGIEYLHRGCDMQILHFDIKPHNILLDENFTPKVSDFGLAKLSSINESIVSLTAARGTLGYIAPELFYKNIGGVSYKADVYSFGMLLMEMVGRRKNLNALAEHSSQIYFPSWIYDRYGQGEDMEMGDATEDEKKLVKKLVIVALWCIQMKPIDRPSMSKTLEMLEGKVELLEMPPKPTLYYEEISTEDHEGNSKGALISSCNSMDTITLDGR